MIPGPLDADADLKIEDLDASEHRNDNDKASEVQPQPQPQTEATPHIERDHEGQELPGMELDVMQGAPINVSSSVFAAPVPEGDSPGVGVLGCWIEPVISAPVPVGGSPGAGVIGGGCDGTPMDQPDIPLREMMRLMD